MFSAARKGVNPNPVWSGPPNTGLSQHGKDIYMVFEPASIVRFKICLVDSCSAMLPALYGIYNSVPFANLRIRELCPSLKLWTVLLHLREVLFILGSMYGSQIKQWVQAVAISFAPKHQHSRSGSGQRRCDSGRASQSLWTGLTMSWVLSDSKILISIYLSVSVNSICISS